MEKENENQEINENNTTNTTNTTNNNIIMQELEFKDIPLFNKLSSNSINNNISNEKESEIVLLKGLKITKILDVKLNVQEINDWVKFS
jgi:hypothetical protein